MMMAVRMTFEYLEIRLFVSVTFGEECAAAHEFNLGSDYTDES
jgi:hypothetical protein